MTIEHPFFDNARCPIIQVTAADMNPIADAWPARLPEMVCGVVGYYQRRGHEDEYPVTNVVRVGDTCETHVPAWWLPCWMTTAVA